METEGEEGESLSEQRREGRKRTKNVLDSSARSDRGKDDWFEPSGQNQR